LDGVRDPEVDQPITAMGFVAVVEERSEGVHVALRLPTYFCAPTFTYLMMAEARAAVETVAGPGRAHVELADHADATTLNEGVAAGAEFAAIFPGQATGGLGDVQDRFRRKTFLVRQERLCRELEAARGSAPDLLGLTLADLPPSRRTSEYVQARGALGLDCRPQEPFLVAADGAPVTADRLRLHRRAASVLTLSYESNGVLCHTLLTARYGPDGTKEPSLRPTSTKRDAIPRNTNGDKPPGRGPREVLERSDQNFVGCRTRGVTA
jgi:metal-sulfur cluster biosynthetic enzyme